MNLRNNTNLTYLHLGGNQLKHIELSNNKQLTLLNLFQNQLSQIDLSNCPSIK